MASVLSRYARNLDPASAGFFYENGLANDHDDTTGIDAIFTTTSVLHRLADMQAGKWQITGANADQ
jgi:hypothetical protein